MIPLIVSLLILAGVGGTVVVSDSTTPGSVLFPVDQAVEKVQLVLAGEDKKVELKAKFASERLDEVDELLLEDADDDNGDDSHKEDIEEGLSFAIDLISQIDEDDQSDELVNQLNDFINKLPEGVDFNIKLGDSGSSFIKARSESKDDENKIKFEIKETGGGNIIIKSESEDGKQEVEIEKADGSKYKMKIEDDGKVEIETEGSDDDKDDDADDDKDEDVDEDEDVDDDKDDDSDEDQDSDNDDDKDEDKDSDDDDR